MPVKLIHLLMNHIGMDRQVRRLSNMFIEHESRDAIPRHERYDDT